MRLVGQEGQSVAGLRVLIYGNQNSPNKELGCCRAVVISRCAAAPSGGRCAGVILGGLQRHLL
jgi:hypothetical protein